MELFQSVLVLFVSVTLSVLLGCTCLYVVIRAALLTFSWSLKAIREYREERRKAEIAFS